MISYDVDDDGLEEVIVGTTEGLLCVVKQDCRAPLFVRVLSATISVVLYNPIRNQLVLVTLEGQCEVIDNFMKPTLSQRTASEPANLYGASPTEGTDNATASVGTPSSRNSGGLSAGGARSGGGITFASSSTSGGHMGAEGAMPTSTSHTSSMDRPWMEVVGSVLTQTTRVFHVPSNCLCADLSPDNDADLIFLGSYDRRFYVYSIINGSCLLSLFVHDPISSVKAFAIPTSAADAHRANTSSHISVYGKKGTARGTDGPLTLDSSPREVDTTPDRQTRAAPPSCIPLVFISTPTHLILLPGGLNDIQRWRRLQPKSAHLPLTVQLQSDDSTPTVRHFLHSQSPQQQHECTRRCSSLGSSGAANAATTLGTVPTAHHHPHGIRPREGERAVSHKPPDALLNSSPALPPPLSTSADAERGGGLPSGTPEGQASSRPGRRDGATTEHQCSSSGVVSGGSHHTSTASVTNKAMTPTGTPGAHGESALSNSQLRRQTRRRAIQAAEMGRPVLVKPLWALRIGSHVLEVPLLQTWIDPHDGGVHGGFAPVAAAAGDLKPSLSGGPLAQQLLVGTAANGSSAHPDNGVRRKSSMPIRLYASDIKASQRAADSPVVSVSSLSSMSMLNAGVSNSTPSSAVLQNDSYVPSSLADTVAASSDRRHGRGSHQSRAAGEDTGLCCANTQLPVMDAAAEPHIRTKTRCRQTHAHSSMPLQDSSSGTAEVYGRRVGGQQRCRSGSDGVDDDGDKRPLSDDGAAAVGGRRPAQARHRAFKAGGDQNEDDEDDGYLGTTTDVDTQRDTSIVSTTSGYNTGSEDSNRGSTGNVKDAVENVGHRVLTSSSVRCLRYHHRDTTGPLQSASPAHNLEYMRAESAPTMLLRRATVADETRHGSISDSGGQLNSESHVRQDDRLGVARGQGDRGGDEAPCDRHPEGAACREKGLQSQHLAQRPPPHLAAAASTPEVTEVRLPTSIDVSVGMSQVAVAFSCEDGLALELRFSVVRLSSLSQRERRRPRGTVRLYDMRSPQSLRVHPTAGSSVAGGAATKGENTEGELPGGDGGDGATTQPAVSPPCPAYSSTLESHCRDRLGVRRRRRRRKIGSQTTYNIYLPTPAAAQAGAAAAPSPLPPFCDTSLASSRQRQRSRSNCSRTNTALAMNPRLTISSTATAASVGAPSMAGEDTGSCAATAAVHRLGETASDAAMLDVEKGLDTYDPGAQVQQYGEDTVVLRAQCLWATRLSDSPLVQRTRVFCVRDRHPSNTFCTVFVASNGTCFAVDGDTLSVVECHIKEDCSSFTLMAVPFSTTPFLRAKASAVTQAEASADTFSLTHDGAVKGVSPTSFGFNVLRGAVGRTVSCVCVSVDELCVYSVGEANQLVQQRGRCSSIGASTIASANGSISLLSRGLPISRATRETESPAAPTEDTTQTMDDTPSCPLSFMDSEMQTLLRELALQLRRHERYTSHSVPRARDGGAAAASEDEHDVETEEDMLMRIKKMLLYDYSEQEWEKLQWLDHAVT
ncbi:hypothetical protein JKF63_05934 [Porcisia hertigi]|uniref:Uncharacterized protein n=1 Tax=Porcisia hertigi TaxID=2761500 RepID=A0A836I857_9TRYP|nr:hypothetical protein JKF63_05934 [Porcisia hertigi]